MRSVVFTCLISITIAAPNGYNYISPNYNIGTSIPLNQQNVQHHHSFNALYSPPVQQFLSNHATGFHTTPTYYNQQQYDHQTGVGGGGIRQQQYYNHYQQTQQPIVTKHIYIHSAPEEPDQEIHGDSSTLQQHKHYNIVFIKAPSQNIHKTALSLANTLNEQKTIIYVLSKKNDYADIKQAIQNVPHEPHKPEVFFIKYRTPEEAQHAQNTIQAQYDTLGGTTKISDEGYAPVSSVIGTLDGGSGGGGFGHSGSGFGHGGGGFGHGGGGFGQSGGIIESGEGISSISGSNFNNGVSSGSGNLFMGSPYLPTG